MNHAKPLPLRKNLSWALFGNLIYGLCQWGMLVVLANLGTKEMLGQFTLAFAICTPAIMLAGLRLRIVLATDAKDTYTFGDYQGLRLTMLALAFPVILGIVLAAAYPLPFCLTVIMVAVAKSLESLSDVYYGFFQKHQRLDRIALSLSIKGFLSLAALAIGVYLTGSLLWGVCALALSWGAVLLLYDIPNSALLVRFLPECETEQGRRSGSILRSIRPRWSSKDLLGLFKLTLPLGFVAAMASLRLNVPRYFISGLVGDGALGLFSAIVSFIVVGARFVNSMGQSASPQLAMYFVAGNISEFRKLIAKIISFSAGIGVAGVVIVVFSGSEILRFLFGPEYAEQSRVFVVVMIAALLEYVNLTIQISLSAARSLKVQGLLLAVSILIVSGLCPLLIPSFGIMGAAMALSFANLAELVLGLLVLRVVLKSAREAA